MFGFRLKIFKGWGVVKASRLIDSQSHCGEIPIILNQVLPSKCFLRLPYSTWNKTAIQWIITLRALCILTYVFHHLFICFTVHWWWMKGKAFCYISVFFLSISYVMNLHFGMCGFQTCHMWKRRFHMFFFNPPAFLSPPPGWSVCAVWAHSFDVGLVCWTWCLSLHSSSLPAAMIPSFDCGTSDSAHGMPPCFFCRLNCNS